MELKYALDEEQKAALGLKETEKIAYAVPFDLVHEQSTEKSWLVVTGDRLIVIGFTGLEADEIEELLAGLEIN